MPPSDSADALLDGAWEALEQGDLAAAARLAKEVVKARGLGAVLQAEAHDILAEVALIEDRPDEAAEHFRQALELDPEDAAALVGLGELELEEDPEGAVELAERALAGLHPELVEEGDPEAGASRERLRLDATLLLVDAQRALGDTRSALRVLGEIKPAQLSLDPAVALDVAEAYYALEDLPHAKEIADLARELADAEILKRPAGSPERTRAVTLVADAHHLLGLIHETRGDRHRMIDSFKLVHALDQSVPPPHFTLTVDRFEAVAAETLEELPPSFKEKLVNVPVVVADYPSLELVAEGSDPRMMGFFSGVPYPEHSAQSTPHLECIFLYQRNIERECHDVAQVEEEIRTTVIHETGHFFGFTEEELDALGLG